MPEYLAPGVYVEETSFRVKSIEGVATSTTGFVGPTASGPTSGARLVTSFEEFKRIYGGLEPAVGEVNHVAHAARVYFENGGKRLYVARVVASAPATEPTTAGLDPFRARWPGAAGNLEIRARREVSPPLPKGALRAGDLVQMDAGLVAVEVDEVGEVKAGGAAIPTGGLRRHTLALEVGSGGDRESYSGLSAHPDAPDSLWRALDPDAPRNPYARVVMERAAEGRWSPAQLMDHLCDGDPTRWRTHRLAGGSDGGFPGSAAHAGGGTGKAATGLAALAEIDDIAIVAAPASGLTDDPQDLREALISHCEALRYRVAILSAPNGTSITDIRALRGQHDSSRAALYYPWVEVRDPTSRGGQRIQLPPDGFIAGIYARTDVERGVHKAPANEPIRGALGLAETVSQGQQEVLNPEGINVLRFFEGRGYRVWGGRTISSDPEWRYVNVRRLFAYLEHSIDKATQWAVFEPNNEALWLKVRLTVESFLTDTWRSGALMGESAKDAFFVRCDHTTMTQGDLDNGRLICLIGVAPVKPAEFVIFRVGQWTADASTL